MVAKCFILLCSIITIGSFANGYIYPLGKCALKDNDCLADKFEKFIQYYSDAGIPELNIGSLDPFEFKNVSISKMDVEFIMKKGLLKGIKKCQLNDFQVSVEKGKAAVDITCDFIIEGQYKFHSDNSLFNAIAGGVIHGNGDLTIYADKLDIKVNYFFKLKKQNGQIYVKGKDLSNLKYSLQDVSVDINNIYIGEKESSALVASLVNKHWKKIEYFFGKDVVDIAMNYANAIVKKYLDNVPATEFIIDDLTPYITPTYLKSNAYYRYI